MASINENPKDKILDCGKAKNWRKIIKSKAKTKGNNQKVFYVKLVDFRNIISVLILVHFLLLLLISNFNVDFLKSHIFSAPPQITFEPLDQSPWNFQTMLVGTGAMIWTRINMPWLSVFVLEGLERSIFQFFLKPHFGQLPFWIENIFHLGCSSNHSFICILTGIKIL